MAETAPITGQDLSSLNALWMPWEKSGALAQPVFSPEAARLSYELAVTAYQMDVEAWRAAGWRDFSFQVDNALLTGPAANKSAGGFTGAISDYMHSFTLGRLRRLNPFSQLRGALRQRDGVDTCKAVVALHPAPAGRYLVAIGFMGTGKRIYDWFSNFLLNREEGMHSGFLQLTKEFEKNCGEILFPETAAELGIAKLTLSDILDECRRPASRFRVWMAGHSQGGAIMQLFTYRAVLSGVLKQHMIGYGFASPRAVYDHPPCDLNAFPLFHIINSADVFPKMGANLHVGRCLIADTDSAMRNACWRTVWADPLFRSVAALMGGAGSSAEAFLLTLAMLRALMEIPADDALIALNGFVGSLIPEKLLGAFGSRREDILQPLMRRVQKGYALSSGDAPLPEGRLLFLKKRVAALIAQYGAKAFPGAALKYIALSHKLKGEFPGNGIGAYQYIVLNRLQSLKQCVWCEPVNCLAFPKERRERRLPGSRFAGLTKVSMERKNRRRKM